MAAKPHLLVIGLTGSIGMGKSATADFFRQQGVAVFNSDAEVHRLYAGEAAPLVEAAFPGSVVSGTVDRKLLAAQLISDPAGFHRLEAIVHPLVKASQGRFLTDQATAGAALAVLEIPLLFEGGSDDKVDVVVVVSAPAEVQRQRVLAREGMTAAKLAAILARQLGDAEQRRRADFIVDTSGSLETTAGQVADIVSQLRGRHGSAFERHWRCT